MKIEILKTKEHYRADCLDLPGTPPVGIGSSKEQAVASLFCRMYIETNELDKWFDHLDFSEPIEIINREF